MGGPLLPYEKELIRTLGCTEEEYRRYAKKVQLQSKLRPAGYEHIPDVKNIGVETLVVLAIGIALSAVSALLMPKPKMPKERKNGKNIRLASRQGAERFGPTTGFDTIADLANYAEPIAVVFARREDDIGGVLSSPQLVWSRVFSYGNEQGIKLMFIIGEQGLGEGIDRPELEGIYLGTSPLDAQYANRFAFYWNRNTNINGRILAKNFAYGTRASADAGDPQTNDDIFLAPRGDAVNAKAFSQSYTPTSNTSFGCYGAIRNGTGYRINWELVPLAIQDGEEYGDAADRLKGSERRRVKVAGDWGQGYYLRGLINNGQKGVGREYGTRMGLRFHNGQEVAPGGPDGHKVFRAVSVGDTATYVIGGNVIEESRYWDNDDSKSVNVDDINNATIRMREQADDLLQVGQIVMIGRTVWVVKSRSEDVWGAGVIGPFDPRGTQSIELECIEVFARGGPADQIGFVSDEVITRGFFTDDQGQGQYPYPAPQNNGLTVGPGYFPLTRVSFGIVRNTRPCETTEFGIKSQVWNRANGLCNFASLPTPAAMRAADNRGDTIQSGSMTTYFNRASVFTIVLRPAGIDPTTKKEYAWEPLGEQFAIRGSRPVDQYNYLRIIHAETREYEFKFVPKSGADLAAFSPDDAEFWLLDARNAKWERQGVLLHRSYTVGSYGSFGVQAAGRLISKGELEFAPELSTGLKTNTENRPLINAPQSLIISEYLPDIDDDSAVAESVIQTGDGWASLPTGSEYRQSAFFYEVFGQPGAMGSSVSSNDIRFNGLRGGRWLTLKFEGRVAGNYPIGHPGEGWKYFVLTGIRVIASSDGMNTGDVFNCRVPVSAGNPRNWGGYQEVGVEVKVASTSATSGPGGREAGYSYEVLGDADDHPIGTRRTARLTLIDGSRSTEIEFGATVVAAPEAQKQKFGVDRVWDQESVAAVPNSTTGNWSRGAAIVDMRAVSDDNPFRPQDSDVGVRYQVDGLRTEQEVIGINSDRVFEENAGITDLSYYTERQTSNESNPEHTLVYVSETITSEPEYDKLTTCGLAIRSGREFSRVDQLRAWLYSGMEVRRFHPSEAGTIGPSNMLPDLVYHLMTDSTAGIGDLVSEQLLDLNSFADACKFLKTNKLYFNGAITEPANLRDYITEIAPFFMMDFAIIGGKFSFTPAIPVNDSGAISTAAVPVSALFTEGNIIEGSFEVEYLEADQRRDFIAVMRWRDEQVNKLPEEKTVTIRWNRAGSENAPIESFDMTDYCCSEAHAEMAAKYLLSIRDRVTHTVSFKTTPEGLNLAPGQFIKVMTQASPYQAADNGVVEDDGTLVMSRTLDDNTYPIYYFDWQTDYVAKGSMTVVNGMVQEQALWGTIVTLRYPGNQVKVYQVQQLTLNEDGLVEVVALEHPTDASGVSEIARDLTASSGRFRRGF